MIKKFKALLKSVFSAPIDSKPYIVETGEYRYGQKPHTFKRWESEFDSWVELFDETGEYLGNFDTFPDAVLHCEKVYKATVGEPIQLPAAKLNPVDITTRLARSGQ